MPLPLHDLVLSLLSFWSRATGTESFSTLPANLPLASCWFFFQDHFQTEFIHFKQTSRHYNANGGTHVLFRFVGFFLVLMCDCVGGCEFVCRVYRSSCSSGCECKDWTSAHTVAWLHFCTKSSLWRTSHVMILTFVGKLEERQLRSGRLTQEGVSAFLVLHI